MDNLKVETSTQVRINITKKNEAMETTIETRYNLIHIDLLYDFVH